MISAKVIKALEFNNILNSVSNYAVLDKTKTDINCFIPLHKIEQVNTSLNKTEEALKLLFTYNVNGIYYCADVSDAVKRAEMGGVLNNSELIRVAQNLKSARMLVGSFSSVNDNSISLLRNIAEKLILNNDLEKEINSKIISEDEISDNASPRLASIRKSIRDINAKIRNKLNSYIRGYGSSYLQEAVVTMRQGRYVIPVKSEHRGQIRGFIHDQSSTGATVFIEPEEVMEGNNELKKAYFDEKDEIYRILLDLSNKVGGVSALIQYNYSLLCEVDAYFARALYAFNNKCTKPIINDKGIIKVNRGRHPLIDKDKVVPITYELGKNYNIILLTGPNTGGKTVTLKLTGLFALMAMSGLYIPADNESEISVFNNVYCDVGDEQSIEQNLSTFSSHFKNIIDIINNLDDKSLVLIDELGAGTDPEEGTALALAVIKKLLKEKCYGIITTHYSKLKEYAVETDGIENASMEFNAETLKPLYKINIGIPGSSNAIEIAKTLGMNREIINDAYLFLSEKQINFENVLKKAEENRRKYEELISKAEEYKENQNKELKQIELERENIQKEREKINSTAKQEIKRIVADKLADAEEIIAELKKILKQAGLESKQVFKASELKNRLENSKYLADNSENTPYKLIPVKEDELKVGRNVYVKSLNSYAQITAIKLNKKEIEVLLGDIKIMVKISDAYNCHNSESKKDTPIKVSRGLNTQTPRAEINVIGKNSYEAIEELTQFIDSAIVNNLTEIKIIHGIGEGVLLKTIRNHLKQDKSIKSFRKGNYGEGENGVTIVTLK